MARRADQLTRAERVIRFIETYCRVPEGMHVGKPVLLRPWQKEFIEAVYREDGPAATNAILTMARKNGKSALIAMLVLAHLIGPEAEQNSQIVSAARSQKQAAIVFKHAAKMVRMNADLNTRIVIRDHVKELYCPVHGVLYAAISAEAETAYGMSPILVIHDELGQVKGERDELYDAIETSQGAYNAPLSIIISTQAPTNGDLLSVLIDDAVHDPGTVVFAFAADPDDDPWDEATWRKANPALGDFRSLADIRKLADKARRLPSFESSFRNLYLNQRVEGTNPFVSRSVWMECGGPVIDSFEGLPVYGGLDLSATSDLTALVLIAPHEGRWHVKPTFWLPGEGLRERSDKDRVPYDVWAKPNKNGVVMLQTTPGRSIEYEFVAEHLRGLFDRLDIRQVAFDRWSFKHLRPWLERAGFSEAELERFVEFGQGFQSMSPALRTLESDLLTGKIVHGDHPILTRCAAIAVVRQDPAGNRKLDKEKSRSRIDGMVALTMARGVAATEALEPEPSYSMFFVG